MSTEKISHKARKRHGEFDVTNRELRIDPVGYADRKGWHTDPETNVVVDGEGHPISLSEASEDFKTLTVERLRQRRIRDEERVVSRATAFENHRELKRNRRPMPVWFRICLWIIGTVVIAFLGLLVSLIPPVLVVGTLITVASVLWTIWIIMARRGLKSEDER